MHDSKAAIVSALSKLKDITNQPDRELTDLLCHVLKCSKTTLATKRPELTQEQEAALATFVEQRTSGIPLAYITGTKGFYGREFIVTKDTLIPRPESELIVEIVTTLARSFAKPTILDVGTGSGSIAITLKCEIPDATVFASDIDAAALAVANRNAVKYKTEVIFIKSNLLDTIEGSFTFIVANLPYLPLADKVTLVKKHAKGLSFEPKHALWGGADGLDYYRKLIPQLEKLSPRHVIFEADPRNCEQLAAACKSVLNPETTEIKTDLAGHKRVVVLTL